MDALPSRRDPKLGGGALPRVGRYCACRAHTRCVRSSSGSTVPRSNLLVPIAAAVRDEDVGLVSRVGRASLFRGDRGEIVEAISPTANRRPGLLARPRIRRRRGTCEDQIAGAIWGPYWGQTERDVARPGGTARSTQPDCPCELGPAVTLQDRATRERRTSKPLPPRFRPPISSTPSRGRVRSPSSHRPTMRSRLCRRARSRGYFRTSPRWQTFSCTTSSRVMCGQPPWST